MQRRRFEYIGFHENMEHQQEKIQYIGKRLAIDSAKLFCAFLVVGMLMVMTTVGANAAQLMPVPASRMSGDFADVYGLVGTARFSDGVFGYEINSAQTDWSKVVAYSGGAQDIMLGINITPPANAEFFVAQSWEGDVDAEVSDQMATDELDAAGSIHMNPISNLTKIKGFLSIQIANYIEAENTVLMKPRYPCKLLAVRWFDSNRQPIFSEKMSFNITHTSNKPQMIMPSAIASNRLIPNANNIADVTASISKNRLIYKLTSATYGEPLTRIKALQNAVECKVHIGTEEAVLAIQNDYVDLPFWIAGNGLTKNFSLIWTDASGNIIGCESLIITIQCVGASPWPSYVNGWTMADVSVSTQNAANILSVPYSNGIVTFKYSGEYQSNAKLDDTRVVFTVRAPDGANSYRLYVEDTPRLYGNQVASSGQTIENDIDFCALEQISDGGFVTYQRPFMKDGSDEDVTVYLSSMYEGTEFGDGMIYVVRWYSDTEGNTPIGSFQWWGTQSDAFYTQVHGQSVSNEGDINAPIVNGCFVDAAGSGNTLNCLYKLQYADSAYYVELSLRNADGWAAQPTSDSVFYLPYPQGYDMNSTLDFTLKHYNIEYENYADTSFIKTPFGLRFEADSLSPFVLSWSKAPVPTPPSTAKPVVPPKTGDSATPMLWLGIAGVMLLVISCFAWYGHKKKRA